MASDVLRVRATWSSKRLELTTEVHRARRFRSAPSPGSIMLKYHPPKSQLWGHRVGKLSAVQLLERSERFLREQTVPARPDTTMRTLSVAWVRNGSDAF